MKHFYTLLIVALAAITLQCRSKGGGGGPSSAASASANTNAANVPTNPQDQAQAIMTASQVVAESSDCSNPTTGSSAYAVCQVATELATNTDLASNVIAQATDTGSGGTNNISNLTQLVSEATTPTVTTPSSGTTPTPSPAAATTSRSQGLNDLQISGIALLAAGVLVAGGAGLHAFYMHYQANKKTSSVSSLAAGHPSPSSRFPKELESAKYRDFYEDMKRNSGAFEIRDPGDKKSLSLDDLIKTPDRYDLVVGQMIGTGEKKGIVSKVKNVGGKQVFPEKIMVGDPKGQLDVYFKASFRTNLLPELQAKRQSLKVAVAAAKTMKAAPTKTTYSATMRKYAGSLVAGLLGISMLAAGGTLVGLGSSMGLADSGGGDLDAYINRMGQIAQGMQNQ